MTKATSAFRSSMAALVAVLITAALAGCSGITTGTPGLVAALSTAATSNQHHTFEETGYDNLNHYTQANKWKDNQTDARKFGLGRLYTVTTYEKYYTLYVGTYSKNCLVAIGFDQAYYELSLDQVPEYGVVIVTNRYGLEKFTYYNDDYVTYKTMKSHLKQYAAACK